MPQFQRYDVVRVVKLIQASSSYNDWGLNKRQPQVGDTGTIIDELSRPNVDTKYVVERVLEDGSTLWISDFLAEEINAI